MHQDGKQIIHVAGHVDGVAPGSKLFIPANASPSVPGHYPWWCVAFRCDDLCDLAELLAASREWASASMRSRHLVTNMLSAEFAARLEPIESRWRRAVEACR